MRRCFAPDLDGPGRLVRALVGLALLAGAACSFSDAGWVAVLRATAGVFGLFEALRGGCLARVGGINTRL